MKGEFTIKSRKLIWRHSDGSLYKAFCSGAKECAENGIETSECKNCQYEPRTSEEIISVDIRFLKYNRESKRRSRKNGK